MQNERFGQLFKLANKGMNKKNMCIYSPMPHTLSYCALIGKCALIRSNTVYSKRGFIAHSVSLSNTHRPGMTEILLKRT